MGSFNQQHSYLETMQEMRLSSSVTTAQQWIGGVIAIFILLSGIFTFLTSFGTDGNSKPSGQIEEIPSLIFFGVMVWLLLGSWGDWNIKISGNKLVAWRGWTKLHVPLEQVVEVGEGWVTLRRTPGFIVYLDEQGNEQKLVFTVSLRRKGVWMDDLIKLANQAERLNSKSKVPLEL